jgi:hypothetical protein
MQLSGARLIAVPAVQSSSHSIWSWSQVGPDGRGKSEGRDCSTCSWSSAGHEGPWGGVWYPSKLWDRLRAGVWCRLVAGIPVVTHRAVQLRSRCSGVVWVWGLEAGAAEGQVSHHVWVWCRAVAWHSLRGGEPCRPTGQGFGRPAVLLLDSGVEKPSTI